MEFLGDRIAVTVSDLTRSDDGEAVMSRSNYDAIVARHQVTVLRPGKGLGHPALVDYDSLPERFRSRYESKYGDPHRAAQEEANRIKMDDKARAFYDGYRFDDGTALKADHQKEYTLNASVLGRLIAMEDRQRVCRNMSGNRTPVSWDGIFASCERWRKELGHTLPKSQARLRDKMREFRKSGYVCLVSGKLSNDNSTKLTPEAARYLIALKRSLVPVYTVQQIFDKFNAEAAARGFKPLRSINTLTQFLARPEIMARWKDSEAGELAAKAIFTRKFSTMLPTRRDVLWYEDGTRLNLYYKAYVPGKGYKAATLDVCEVIDAYSEVFLGCCICENENFESIYTSVRNAVETAGHLPCEFVTDNQGGTKRKDAQAFFQRIARVAHTTQPDNASSKTIESIFGRFQEQVLHQKWNFTGQNITAKASKSRVKADLVIANVDALPTREEVIAQYMECREQWNSMPHPTYGTARNDLYASSVNDESPVLTDVMRREVFWVRTQDAVAYTNSGITITVAGVKYTYEVYGADGMPDVRFLSENAGRKYVVEYDPRDMGTVRLNLEDKKYGLQFVTEAKPYWRNHRAIFDQKEGERASIIRIMEANDRERVRRDVENRALEYEFGVAPEQHGLQSPRLKGIKAERYEQLADEIRGGQEKTVRLPGDELPDSVGKLEKETSSFDPLAIYNRM